jgi:hypothetical protein
VGLLTKPAHVTNLPSSIRLPMVFTADALIPVHSPRRTTEEDFTVLAQAGKPVTQYRTVGGTFSWLSARMTA